MLFLSATNRGKFTICDSDDFTKQDIDIDTLRYYVDTLGIQIQGVNSDGTIKVPVYVNTEQVLRYKALCGADIKINTKLELSSIETPEPLHLRLDTLCRGIAVNAVFHGDCYLTWSDKLIRDFIIKRCIFTHGSTITVDLHGCTDSALINTLYKSSKYGHNLYLINDLDSKRAMGYFRNFINKEGYMVLGCISIPKLPKCNIDYLISEENINDMWYRLNKDEVEPLKRRIVINSSLDKFALVSLYNNNNYLALLRVCFFTHLAESLDLWIDFCSKYAPDDNRFSVLAKDLCEIILEKEVIIHR